MKPIQIIFVMVVIFSLALTGCSSAEYAPEFSKESSYTDSGSSSSDLYSTSSNQSSDEEANDMNSTASTEQPLGLAGAPGVTDRKIIREQQIEQEVKDLQAVIADVERKLSQLDGAYMQDMEEWKNEFNNSIEYRARLTMRVPVDQLTAFLGFVEAQGNVLMRSQTGQDVTAEFVDNESRLRNLTAHEERILQLYEKAETIEEMLQIEAELSRIRGSIEQIEGRQNYLSEVTSTAKITLDLVQVEEYDYIQGQKGSSMFTDAWAGLKKSLAALSVFGVNTFIVFIAGLPFIILIGALATGVYFLIRKIRAIRKSRSPENKG